MDRQYGNPSEYQQVEYAPQQMMYSVAPGQQVVGPPLVNVPGGPASMPPHLWAAADTHHRQGGAPTQPGGPGVGGHPRGGHAMGDGVGGAPLHHHSGADAMEELLGPFPVVRLRGLPFEAQPRDVVLFFQGIGVLDVVMMPRGEAIVVFNTVMDCQMALQRDRQNMGRRYIEIFQAKRFDYYNAVGHTHWHTGGHGHNLHNHHGGHPHHHQHGNNPHHSQQGGEHDHRGHGGRGRPYQHREEKERHGSNGGAEGSNGGSREAAIANSERAQNSGILKLRGLPFSSNKQDIQQFFEGYPVRPEQIQFVFRNDGRLTGEAFVTFAGGAEEAKAAQRAKDRSTIGSRYVEIFNTTPEELARLTGGGSNGGNANGGPGANTATTAAGGSSTTSGGGSTTTVGESSSSSAGSSSTTGGGEGPTTAAAAAPAVVPAEGADAPASSSSPTSASM